MKTLQVGIADYEEIKARTMRIARGDEKPAPDDPKVWFTSTESFAQILLQRKTASCCALSTNNRPDR